MAPAPTNTPTSTGTGTSVTITIVGNSGSQAFSPNPATAATGQTVVFRNSSAGTHRIVADSGAWDAGTIAPGSTSPAVPVTSTPAPFHCTIHQSMVGTIG